MIQAQVLNKILQDKDPSFLINNNLDETFFSDYITEYRFIKSHIDLYNSIPDMETFIAQFTDFDVIEVTESDEYLLDALYEDKNKRALQKTFNKIRDYLMNNDTKGALDEYLNSQGEFATSRNLQCIDIIKDVSRYDDYLDVESLYDKYYVTTGFKELDDIIGGWDRREELATIVARPNVGKSWFLLKCAVEAARKGLNVGVYSGEMSAKKVGFRCDTLISNISNSQIIRGKRECQNDYKLHLDRLKKLIPGSLQILTPLNLGHPAGVNDLRCFIETKHLDMLCVDQHSLLEDDRKAKNPVERAANISKDLKNLQVIEKIPIIAASQQNRASTDSGVGTEHVAQSDRIAQDSTIVIFLDKKHDDENLITMKLVKSRDSVNMKDIQYSVNFDRGIFKPMDDRSSSPEEVLNNQISDFGSDENGKIMDWDTFNDAGGDFF